jgi:hypothetical protein
MRRLLAAMLLATPLALLPNPVWAKPGEPAEPPESSSYVSGPGIDVPIVLQGRAALRMLYLTTYRAAGQAEPNSPSRRELGPAYQAWYFAPAADGRLRLIRQELYPCAESSVWAYTPTEQGPFERGFLPVPISTGWWHSTAMLGTVASWGLPCGDRTSAATAAGGHGWGGPLAAVVWFGLAIAVVLVGVARVSRGRTVRGPERV